MEQRQADRPWTQTQTDREGDREGDWKQQHKTNWTPLWFIPSTLKRKLGFNINIQLRRNNSMSFCNVPEESMQGKCCLWFLFHSVTCWLHSISFSIISGSADAGLHRFTGRFYFYLKKIISVSKSMHKNASHFNSWWLSLVCKMYIFYFGDTNVVASISLCFLIFFFAVRSCLFAVYWVTSPYI